MLYLQPLKNDSISHHLFIQNASSVNPQQMIRLYLTDDMFRSNLYPQWKYLSTNFNIAS